VVFISSCFGRRWWSDDRCRVGHIFFCFCVSKVNGVLSSVSRESRQIAVDFDSDTFCPTILVSIWGIRQVRLRSFVKGSGGRNKGLSDEG